MIVYATFKRVSKDTGDFGARIETLFARVSGNAILDWNGRQGGAWTFNVIVSIFPSGKVWVEVVDNDRPTVRPTEGILQGMKITDGTAIKAAVGELGVHWLNQFYKGKLTLPDIMGFMKYQEFDSCMNCRWHRRVRMGSDEMDMDFSDEDGRCLRDREKPNGAYQPEHVCLLFGIFLEEQFSMMSEINRIVEGGVVGGGLVNLAAGFGVDPVWRRLRDIVDHDIRERACLFHRQSKFQLEEAYDTTQVVKVKEKGAIRKRLASTGPKTKSDWEDALPVGWLPKYGQGILIPGGIEMRCEAINLSEVNDVQQGMSLRQKRLQSGGEPLPVFVPAGKQTTGDTVEYAQGL